MITSTQGQRTLMTTNIPQGSVATKHQIGIKTSKQNNAGDRNMTFKSGGPIRATGAVIEKMENLINTGNSFSNTHASLKQSNTPQVLGPNKMPQRPGSSKPV